MTIIDHPLYIFSAIITGLFLQFLLGFIKKRRGDAPSTGYPIIRIILTLFWLAFGVLMLIGGIILFTDSQILMGVGNIALGEGMMVAGWGRAYENNMLKDIGTVILAFGPLFIGLASIITGSYIPGAISTTMGIGILASTLENWIGYLSQIGMGLLIVGSAMLILVGLTGEPGALTTMSLVISILMVLMGAFSIWGGSKSLLSPRPSRS